VAEALARCARRPCQRTPLRERETGMPATCRSLLVYIAARHWSRWPKIIDDRSIEAANTRSTDFATLSPYTVAKGVLELFNITLLREGGLQFELGSLDG
jgi:hypothetical protein